MTVKLDVALELNNSVLLAFDIVSVTISLRESERIESVNTLSNVYGSQQSSKFKGNVNVAMSLIPTSKVAPSTIVQFFEDFIQAVRKASEKGNELVNEVMRSVMKSNTELYRWDLVGLDI